MSSRKSSSSQNAGSRLQDALVQAQRLGVAVAERLDEHFGDELAVLKTQGKKVIRSVRARSHALNERVQREERALPQILRETTQQLDDLVKRLAQVSGSDIGTRSAQGPSAKSAPDEEAAARPAGQRPRRRRKPGGSRRPRHGAGGEDGSQRQGPDAPLPPPTN